MQQIMLSLLVFSLVKILMFHHLNMILIILTEIHHYQPPMEELRMVMCAESFAIMFPEQYQLKLQL